MGKCEHGLTSKECYVCASPKHGEAPQGGADALRLADALVADRWHPRYREHAAAELRRLHAVNGELLEALKLLLDEQEGPPSIRRHRQWQAAVDACRAAIARAEGEKE